MKLGRLELEALILGGGVLGGGGGGSREDGLRLGEAALAAGTPRLVPIDALPGGALVATASLVGAPASPHAAVAPADHLRAWELLCGLVDRPLAAVITCENGAAASVNGWLQSASAGIPIVDAPADGRAHPTGDMGSLGLEDNASYVSCQAAVGGDRARHLYVEQQVRGGLNAANRIVRSAADAAGGLVAVARNPVPVSFLQQRAAVGAIEQAITIGRAVMIDLPRGVDGVANRLCALLDARVHAAGLIDAIELRTQGGYDVGIARVGGLELSIWNEYMTLEREAERLATFPDLIVTLDAGTGLPLTSAELATGRRVLVLAAHASALTLGAGVLARRNLAAIERATGKEILKYLEPTC